MFEIMILVVACLTFFIPGKILDEILALEKNDLAIRVYSTFIFALFFSSLVGIILSNFGLYTLKNVWIIYLSISLLYLMINIIKIGKIKEKISACKKINVSKSNIIIILVLIFTVLSFLSFQRYDFPVGHDATKHYLNMIHLIENGKIPNTELGSSFLPFYPRGFHFSATTLSFLCLKGVDDIFTILKIFLCFVVLFFPISIYCLSRKLLSKDLKVFPLIFFLYFAPLLTTRGNYPMMVSALCLGLGIVYIKQYLESEEKRKDIKLFLSLTIILFYSVCSHLIYAEYFYLTIVSLIIFEVIAKKISIKKSLFFVTPILLSVLFYALILFLFQKDLFYGQIKYLTTHSYATLGVENHPFQDLIFRESSKEFISLFIYPLFSLFFVLGIIEILKKNKMEFISIFILSMIVSFVQILPLEGREVFYLVYTLPIIFGVGFNNFKIFLKKIKLKKTFLIAYLSFLALFLSLEITYISESPRIGSDIPIIDEDTIALLDFIEENKIENKNIATLFDISPLYIDVKTNNKVLRGDNRIHDIKSYNDIYEAITSESAEETIRIIKEYKIDIVCLSDFIIKNYSINSTIKNSKKEKVGNYTLFMLSPKNLEDVNVQN